MYHPKQCSGQNLRQMFHNSFRLDNNKINSTSIITTLIFILVLSVMTVGFALSPYTQLLSISEDLNLKGNGTNENTGARIINVSTSGVAFTDYTYKNRRTGGTLTVANQFCVPRRIYGIKQITEYRWHRTA